MDMKQPTKQFNHIYLLPLFSTQKFQCGDISEMTTQCKTVCNLFSHSKQRNWRAGIFQLNDAQER